MRSCPYRLPRPRYGRTDGNYGPLSPAILARSCATFKGLFARVCSLFVRIRVRLRAIGILDRAKDDCALFCAVLRDNRAVTSRVIAQIGRTIARIQKAVRETVALAGRVEAVAHRARLPTSVDETCAHQPAEILLQHAPASFWQRLLDVADRQLSAILKQKHDAALW